MPLSTLRTTSYTENVHQTTVCTIRRTIWHTQYTLNSLYDVWPYEPDECVNENEECQNLRSVIITQLCSGLVMGRIVCKMQCVAFVTCATPVRAFMHKYLNMWILCRLFGFVGGFVRLIYLVLINFLTV